MKIRELYSDPTRWTKGCFAKNKEGIAVPFRSSDAYAFCLMGAVSYCYSDNDNDEMALKVDTKIRNYLRQKTGSGKQASWNDAPERTYEEVKAMVDELDV